MDFVFFFGHGSPSGPFFGVTIDVARRSPRRCGSATGSSSGWRYNAMPPREAQERLMPVSAFEGTVSTPELERYDFVRYLSAARLTAPEAKRRGLLIGNGSPVAQAA